MRMRQAVTSGSVLGQDRRQAIDALRCLCHRDRQICASRWNIRPFRMVPSCPVLVLPTAETRSATPPRCPAARVTASL